MKKFEITQILGRQVQAEENDNGTALIVSIISDDLDVIVTLPYELHELHYEAKNKLGETLVQDSHECYGDLELDDYKECLQDIVDIAKVPKFRMTNNDMTVEAHGYKWHYFFGEFSS